MKKSDLKDGMVVELRNGDRLIVLGAFLKGKKICCRIDKYQENLIHKTNNDFDIMKIKNAINYYGPIESMFKYFNDLDTLWERLGYNFKPGDKVQVRDFEGKNFKWKNRYFLKKEERAFEYNWITTSSDEFAMGMSFEEASKDCSYGTPYKYIRPYKEEE